MSLTGTSFINSSYQKKESGLAVHCQWVNLKTSTVM